MTVLRVWGRTGTYEVHVAPEDIDSLRQFVDARPRQQSRARVLRENSVLPPAVAVKTGATGWAQINGATAL